MRSKVAFVVILFFWAVACSSPEDATEPVTPVPPTSAQTFSLPTSTVKLTQMSPLPMATLSSRKNSLPAVACDKLAFLSGQSIYLINPDGSGQVHLRHSSEESSPVDLRWSPDGTRISYSIVEGGGQCRNVYVLNADGTDHRWLFRLCRYDDWKWSPDSQYIDILASSSTRYSHIVLHVETGETICEFAGNSGYYAGVYEPFDCDPVELSDGRWWYLRGHVILDEYEQRWALIPTHERFRAYSHSLSPNKEWVIRWIEDVESEQRRLVIARSNGEGLKPLVGVNPVIQQVCGIAWSRDSQYFAITAHQDGRFHLWTARSDDGALSLLIELPIESCSRHLGWSPSGRHISLSLSGQGYVVEWPDGQMYVVGEDPQISMRWSPMTDYLLVESLHPSVWDADTHKLISLDDEFERCEWSPDGHWLACLGKFATVVFNVEDGERVKVPVIPEGYWGWWTPRWSPNGQWLSISSSHSDYKGIWIFNISSHQTVQIANQGESPTWSPPCE